MLPALVSEPLEVSRRYEHPDTGPRYAVMEAAHTQVRPRSRITAVPFYVTCLSVTPKRTTAMTASYDFAFLTWGTDRPGRLLYVYFLPEIFVVTGMQPFQKTVKDTQAKEPHALLLCNLITTAHGNGTA